MNSKLTLKLLIKKAGKKAKLYTPKKPEIYY